MIFFTAASFGQTELRNDRYVLKAGADGVVTVEGAGMKPQTLRPEFTVLSSQKAPKLIRYTGHPNYMVAARKSLRWENPDEPIDEINAWLASSGLKAATGLTGTIRELKGGGREWEFRKADGTVSMKVSGRRALETSRPFSLGNPVVLQAAEGVVRDGSLEWKFAPQAGFAFSAKLTLPPGDADPVITYTITPKTKAFFSVAFTGAPSMELARTIYIPQECDSRGHKQFNFVMSEPDLGLPRAQVSSETENIALTVDPAECRFRLPSIEDSRFGFMLEERDGRLKPVLFAPLFGGVESGMEAGKPWSFSFRYVQKPGDWKETYTHIARQIHGFREMRDNSGPGSLNGTLERVMDYIANRNGGNRAMWDSQQKYHDYYTDKTGVFKPFSPLYGLSAAIVMDDENFFHERALPNAEYAISRRFSVFAPYDNSDNKQANSAVRTVGEPYLGYTQLLSLYEILQRRTPGLLALADKSGFDAKKLSDVLARWQLTGDAALLVSARDLGKRTAGRAEEDLFNLMDLAEATHDPADILMAKETAYYNVALRLNLYPMPPDITMLVDKGGVAPVHPHSVSRHQNIWGYPAPRPVPAPEQTVPAWRLARVGLQSLAYPMEYWMNINGAALRIAGLAQDSFLRDVAHWGFIGRFGNYPGDNRSIDSLVQERPDAVEAMPWDWNFATVNPGHAWDFAGALLDFLVSDGFERSRGEIDFPGLRAAGTSFRVRIYGGGAGKFYGDKGVYLWLPRGLVKTDNQQIDWLAGHGNGNLYLALWNQSFKEETVTVNIARSLAECDGTAEARAWINNAPSEPVKVVDNRLTVTLPPKDIAAFAIPALTHPGLQARLYSSSFPPLGPHSFTTTDTSFGPLHAMLIRSDRTTAFVYTEALPENVISARLRWKQGKGEWQEMTDDIYPYEFSPVLDDNGGDFACVLEIEDAQQKVVRSPVVALSAGENAPGAVDAPASKPFLALPPAPSSDERPVDPPMSDDFVAYIKQAANRDDYGLRDGRYYPYSTPQGRRIAWRQPVWDKMLYAKGCTPGEAEKRLRAELAGIQARLITLLAARQPAVDFAALNERQRETLIDLALTENPLRPELLDAVLAGDWDRMIRDHLYVRYAGHAPDHFWNKAFAQRWNIE